MSTRTNGFTLVEILVVVAVIGIIASIAMYNFGDAQIKSKISAAHNDLRILSNALELYFVEYNAYPFCYPISGFDEDAYLKENLYKDNSKESEEFSHKELTNAFHPPRLGEKEPHWVDEQYQAQLEEFKVQPEKMQTEWKLRGLDSRIDFLQELPFDVFGKRYHYEYHNRGSFGIEFFRKFSPNEYYLFSIGPDQAFDNGSYFTLYTLDDDHKKILRDLVESRRLDRMEDRLLICYDPSNGLESHGDIIKTGP